MTPRILMRGYYHSLLRSRMLGFAGLGRFLNSHVRLAGRDGRVLGQPAWFILQREWMHGDGYYRQIALLAGRVMAYERPHPVTRQDRVSHGSA